MNKNTCKSATSKTIQSPLEDQYKDFAEAAEAFYNNTLTDAFCCSILGGEDAHIGIYETPNTSILESGRKSVRLWHPCCPML